MTTETTTTLDDLNARQRSLAPPDRLANVHAVVIGVGAGGRQTALQLTSLGVPRLTLFDHDEVEAVNLRPQGFYPDQLGRDKAAATASDCRRHNPLCRVAIVAERFGTASLRKVEPEGDLCVFCCVDSISTRRLVWRAAGEAGADFFVDGRAASETIRTLAYSKRTLHRFEASLFEDKEAYVGACTAQATIYVSAIAAGLAVHQFSRWLRGLPLEEDLLTNLLAAEMIKLAR